METITNTANFDYRFRETEYNANASVTVNVENLPIITMEKKSNVDTVYSGDVITYFVTILISDFNGAITQQVFSDNLPSSIEFIEGTLTVDAEPFDGNPSHIDVNWLPNTEHLIIYQCLVL